MDHSASSKLSFPPISDDEWPAEIAHLRQGFAGALNVYRTMAHHPALLSSWVGLREHLVTKTALGAQYSEVVILRAGFRQQTEYEWSHHVVRARKSGLSDERIASIRLDQDQMSTIDALLTSAVDALLDKGKIEQPLQQELVREVSVEGMFDLIATVGFYSILSYMIKSFDTPLDENIKTQLAHNPLIFHRE